MTTLSFDKDFEGIDNETLERQLKNYKEQLEVIEANIEKVSQNNPRGLELLIIPRNQLRLRIGKIETELELRKQALDRESGSLDSPRTGEEYDAGLRASCVLLSLSSAEYGRYPRYANRYCIRTQDSGSMSRVLTVRNSDYSRGLCP